MNERAVNSPERPTVLNIYVWAIVLLLIVKAVIGTVHFMSIHPNDPGKAIIASLAGELLVSLIWLLPFMFLMGKSHIAQWILIVITFPVGLLLLSSQVETYLNYEGAQKMELEKLKKRIEEAASQVAVAGVSRLHICP